MRQSLPESTAPVDGGIAESLSKAVGKSPGLREKMVQLMRWSENVPKSLFADKVAPLGEHCITMQTIQGP